MCAEAVGICCMEQQVVFNSIFFSFCSGLIFFDHPYSVSDRITTKPLYCINLENMTTKLSK
jgi:hypothetical protein